MKKCCQYCKSGDLCGTGMNDPYYCKKGYGIIMNESEGGMLCEGEEFELDPYYAKEAAADAGKGE